MMGGIENLDSIPDAILQWGHLPPQPLPVPLKSIHESFAGLGRIEEGVHKRTAVERREGDRLVELHDVGGRGLQTGGSEVGQRRALEGGRSFEQLLLFMPQPYLKPRGLLSTAGSRLRSSLSKQAGWGKFPMGWDLGKGRVAGEQ